MHLVTTAARSQTPSPASARVSGHRSTDRGTTATELWDPSQCRTIETRSSKPPCSKRRFLVCRPDAQLSGEQPQLLVNDSSGTTAWDGFGGSQIWPLAQTHHPALRSLGEGQGGNLLSQKRASLSPFWCPATSKCHLVTQTCGSTTQPTQPHARQHTASHAKPKHARSCPKSTWAALPCAGPRAARGAGRGRVPCPAAAPPARREGWGLAGSQRPFRAAAGHRLGPPNSLGFLAAAEGAVARACQEAGVNKVVLQSGVRPGQCRSQAPREALGRAGAARAQRRVPRHHPHSTVGSGDRRALSSHPRGASGSRGSHANKLPPAAAAGAPMHAKALGKARSAADRVFLLSQPGARTPRSPLRGAPSPRPGRSHCSAGTRVGPAAQPHTERAPVPPAHPHSPPLPQPRPGSAAPAVPPRCRPRPAPQARGRGDGPTGPCTAPEPQPGPFPTGFI